VGSLNLDYFIHAANILLLAAYRVRDGCVCSLSAPR